jgi:nucleotide-binding universal stress UspA family protein
MYKRILVPLDGSELALAALEHARGLAQVCGATLVLLHVRDRRSGSDEGGRRYLEFAERQYLADAAVPVELAVRAGAAASEIVDAAGALHADLIAMATHGRSGVQRVVYGSVAEHVLRGASVPVLLVRVAGGEAPE